MSPTNENKESVVKKKKSLGKVSPKVPGWRWNHVHLTCCLLGIAFIVNLLIGTFLYLLTSLDIPDVSSIGSYNPPATSVFVDDTGLTIAEFSRENRFVIGLSSMPDLLAKAFVAAEDGRFYHHGGVDGWSVLRAMFNNIRSGRRSQGGSTITQQVARSLLLSPEKTYIRKIREAVLAYRIDRLLEKEAILHLYLNQIYLGEGAYGVEAAARTYFGKSVGELNLAEISLLAGLPQAPSRYSPFKNYKLAKGRQRYVLNRMAADGYIAAEEARLAYRKVLLWKTEQESKGSEKYFVELVRQHIEEKFGSEQLLAGGMVVHTTLNRNLQHAAATAVNKGIVDWRRRKRSKSDTDPQAALVAMELSSNRVLAMVGGTDFDTSQYNRAVQARRQPGSAFKPLIYAAALDRNSTPADLVIDEPVYLQGAGVGETWEPENFSGKFFGPTTIRNGLIKSRNIVTIKILQEMGVETVRTLAVQMGINSPLTNNLSLALGTSGVSLLELTNAYTVFSNNGEYRSPVFIDKITDRYGDISFNADTQPARRVIKPQVAYQVTHLMKGVIEEGTGRLARGLPVEAAGKTGTTDRNMDAWFIGYTPDLAAGVWLGFDQNITLGEEETGGRAAAPIWRNFMGKALDNRPPQRKKFTVPEGIRFIPMNPETGEIMRDAGGGVREAFREDLLPAGGKNYEQ